MIVLLLAAAAGITVHEAAHAWAALALGDHTAAELGRCSLLPWRHFDVMGSLVAPALGFLLAGFLVGYGRSVPLDRDRLGRRGYVLALLAGPASNAVLAALCLLLGWDAAAGVNAMLAVFNLMPLTPMDGGRIALELIR